MITIISGDINSGKTTKLVTLYKKKKDADGFVSIRKTNMNVVEGYDVLRLSTNERRPLIIRKNLLPNDFESESRVGPYYFSTDTVEWVEHSLRYMVAHGTKHIFLDEIGPMVIEGQCFDRILIELMDSGCHLYMTVRNQALNDVIDRYNIIDYTRLEA